MKRASVAAVGLGLFVLLAIANSAGYRYGASDQAFYLPAIARALDPAGFPRDGALLDAQARLTAADEVMAGAVRLARPLDPPAVVLIAYIGGLLLLAAAFFDVGRCLTGSRWTGAALAAALTLRHGIPRAGVNTLEGYFHPRLLVFAAGVLAVAWFLRRRTWRAIVLVLLASAMHPTTGVWFLIWIGAAAVVADRPARGPVVAAAAAAAAIGAWAVTVGPLAGRLVRMDPVWLEAIEGKDYLFPDRWPAYAWAANLAYPALIGVFAYVRSRDRRLTNAERGLVAGAFVLFAIFLASLPLNGLRVALVVQLQIPRIFWLLDFLATALLVAWITERKPLRGPLAAAALLVLSAVRGAYIMAIEFPERRLIQVRLPEDDWRDAMTWAATTGAGTHWLAHPGHAHRYGSSVRVAAARDVFHEAVKDAALAMYDRQIAERVVERSAALPDFDALDVPAIRALASRYELDFMVTEARGLALPIAFSNARFVVYRLR